MKFSFPFCKIYYKQYYPPMSHYAATELHLQMCPLFHILSTNLNTNISLMDLKQCNRVEFCTYITLLYTIQFELN
jgi:hypothetical protein